MRVLRPTKCCFNTMLGQYVVLVVVFLQCCVCAGAKICGTVEIKNSHREAFKKLEGCEVIDGNLEILLCEQMTEKNFTELNFPKLIEVRGFLMLHRVSGLKSLGQLFPNLTVIRGENTFQEGFSFVLSSAVDLEQVCKLLEINLRDLYDIVGYFTTMPNNKHLILARRRVNALPLPKMFISWFLNISIFYAALCQNIKSRLY